MEEVGGARRTRRTSRLVLTGAALVGAVGDFPAGDFPAGDFPARVSCAEDEERDGAERIEEGADKRDGGASDREDGDRDDGGAGVRGVVTLGDLEGGCGEIGVLSSFRVACGRLAAETRDRFTSVEDWEGRPGRVGRGIECTRVTEERGPVGFAERRAAGAAVVGAPEGGE